jgi:ABC-2 type transport system ATP-binding protein
MEEHALVDSVQVADGGLRVTLKPDIEDFSDLANTLIQRGIRFNKFAAEEINLESAFMAFTKGAGAKI